MSCSKASTLVLHQVINLAQNSTNTSSGIVGPQFLQSAVWSPEMQRCARWNTTHEDRMPRNLDAKQTEFSVDGQSM